VSAVVVYHSVPTLAPGGYVGVDVFFVISGYLITGLIAKDIDRGRFSIASFYVRRTKRILPALFVVLLATLALGIVLLTPTELGQLGRLTAATAGFVSNIAFWMDTGYFDSAAESKPLLHTWSLSVEEQFYVAWPLTLALLYGRRRWRTGLVLLTGVSFVMSVYLTMRHQPTAFFLLPPRAWELLAGAALALGLVPAPPGGGQRNLAAAAGLAGILGSIWFLDRSSAFPGWNALASCLGTSLVIAAGSRGDNIVSRHLLSRTPVVFVGLISYSLYLWHWPLLTLARITWRGHLPPVPALVVVAVAVLLSVLTWRFVERPFRAGHFTPAAAPILLRYGLASMAILVLGLSVQASGGFRDLVSPELQRVERARYEVNPRSGACLRWQSMMGPLPGAECMSGAGTNTPLVVIWGDSHADAVAPGIVAEAGARGYATHQLTMAGCPPLLDAEVRGPGADYTPCAAFNRQVREYIETTPAVQAVFLSARWALYTENVRFGDDPGPITYLVDSGDREETTAASKRVFSRALRSTVSALANSGRSVILLGTIPPLGVNVPDCLARNLMPFSGVRRCEADADEVQSHIAFADQQIAAIAARQPEVCVYLPVRALCTEQHCPGILGDDILYANDDHLSITGARFLASQFPFDGCLPSKSRGPALKSSDRHDREREASDALATH
jgi:peptidoglycan/LPS O-acetylase OafA/YrhL